MGRTRTRKAAQVSRERRFLVDHLNAPSVELTGDEAHHLIHVLRLSTGDEVALFDGRGTAQSARVTSIDTDKVELELGDPLPAHESPIALTLAVAVPKGEKMSLIVQKVTELGVAAVQPLITDRGEVGEDWIQKRLERWRRIALEAAKQSARSRVPRIETPKPFDDLDIMKHDTWLLRPGAPPLRETPSMNQPIIAIGPEGGWSTRELALAHERAVLELSLGPRTLRTETAAITATAVIQWLSGDLTTT